MRKQNWKVTFDVAATAQILVHADTEDEAIEIAESVVSLDAIDDGPDYDLVDAIPVDPDAEED